MALSVRWYQLRLRSCFLALFAASAIVAIGGSARIRYEREQHALLALAEVDGVAVCESLLPDFLCWIPFAEVFVRARGLSFVDENGLRQNDIVRSESYARRFHAAFVRVRHLTHLESLDCAGSLLEDRDLQSVSAFRHLLHIDITGTKVGDLGLAQLSRVPLREASLASTSVGDEGLRSLHLERIQALELSDTQVSVAGVRYLKRARNLQRLSLSGKTLTDECLPVIRELPSLQEVMFAHSGLTPHAVRAIQETRPSMDIIFHTDVTLTTNDSTADTVFELNGACLVLENSGSKAIPHNRVSVSLQLSGSGESGCRVGLDRTAFVYQYREGIGSVEWGGETFQIVECGTRVQRGSQQLAFAPGADIRIDLLDE